MSFIKTTYLFGEDEFNLFTPVQIVDKIYDNNAKLIKYKIIDEQGEQVNKAIGDVYMKFTPSAKNMLASEYKGKHISVITDHSFMGKFHYHRKAVVLTEKRGSYTMAKCLTCGQESPLALNSFILAGNFDKDVHFQCTEKNY